VEILSKDSAAKVAEILLKVEAVKLRPEQPFKWSSGWNSPIYCDNRIALSFPDERTYIKLQLAAAVKKFFQNAEAIAGVATAGIPQGALIADALNLPFIYVRPKPKDHGMENLIEGKITKGQKVVVVEDLISTGGSSLKACDALKDAGFEIEGMVAIFNYGFKVATENFKKADVKLVCLSNYSELILKAESLGIVNAGQISSLTEWRNNPETWGI
jgi:orotate phosphoribosyltransferase